MKLLQRFYDPAEGDILLDERPLRCLDLKWLRKQIAVVSQEPDLFNTSIYNNIRHGLVRSGVSSDEEEVREAIVAAAKSANIHDIIMEMPDQYNTIVGERGARLSGMLALLSTSAHD